MCSDDSSTGAATYANIAECDHGATVAEAFANGEKAAFARLDAIFGAEGIKEDGARMMASLKLAFASPDMAAADVVAFVVRHVAASAPVLTEADSYSARRVAEGEGRWTAEKQDQARQLNKAAQESSARTSVPLSTQSEIDEDELWLQKMRLVN